MNRRSSYIESLPLSSYQVIESGLNDTVIDRFLKNNKGKLANAFANLIDRYAADKKGLLFTTAITASGYTNDVESLQDFYKENATVIDEYFSYVDMQALAAAIGGDLEKEIITGSMQWIRDKTPAFLMGAGILGLILIIRRKSK